MSDVESAGVELATIEDLLGDLSGLWVTEDDPTEATRAIVERILRAETVDEVLAGQGTVGAREVAGRPLKIEGFRLARSDFEGGPTKAYAIVDAVDATTGERLTVTCGGANVLAQLVRLHHLNGFPVEARFVEAAKPTARGYRPLWLVPAERF